MMKSSAAPPAPPPSLWQDAYQRHGGAVLAFLESRLGRREEAEDLLQETFVRAIRAGGLREAAKLRSYLFTIAHNLLLNRRRRRRPVLLFSQAREAESARLGEVADGEAEDPESAARFGDLERRLDEILAAMPDAQRIAFRSAVLERTPYRRIATDNGWTLAQVKINVYRARRRAMEALGDLLPAGSPPGESS